MLNRTEINKLSEYLSSQPIEMAWIFGSYSRSQEEKNSDIDLIVKFSPTAQITLFQYLHLITELEKLTGKKSDLVEEGQLKTVAVESADKDKILIYERKAQG